MIGKADEELKMTLRGAFEKVLHKIIEVLFHAWGVGKPIKIPWDFLK